MKHAFIIYAELEFLTILKNHQRLKKYEHKESYDKSKPIAPNRYQILKPTFENIELVFENIQNALRLPGNDNKLNRNGNILTSQNNGSKRPSVVIKK